MASSKKSVDLVKWSSHDATDGEDQILIITDTDDDDKKDQSTKEEDGEEESSGVSGGLTRYLAAVVSFSIIGGFLFGYDTGVISGALLVLDKDFHYQLTTLQKELIVSVTIGAAALGAVLGGPSNELLGRRLTIVIASAVFTTGAIVMAVPPTDSWSWLIVLLGRLIVGIGIGLASMTVPMYLAECSPLSLRGRLTVLDNMAVTCGQFVAGVVDLIFSYVPQGWRYMLGVAAIPSLIRIIAFVFLPESPRWLISKGKYSKAKVVLRKLRGDTVSEVAIDKELQNIRRNIEEASYHNRQNIFKKLWTIFTHRHLLLAVIVGCGLQAIQQLSGINTLMYYSPTILKMAGAQDNHVAIGLGAVVAFGNFVFTAIGLYFIERAGRRRLIMASLVGVVISLLVLVLAFYLASTSTHSSCPTSVCSSRTCDDCVLEDNCFFCFFPTNASYQSLDIGYCIDRPHAWGLGERAASCWVTQAIATAGSYECQNSSYIAANDDLPDDISYHGNVYSACPNKFSWLALSALVLYIVSFAPGMGPVPWTVNAEIYPNWARSVGNSLSSTTNWMCNLGVSITFLHLTRILTRYGAFILYMILAIAGLVFIFFLLPETRGKKLEEVEELFKGQRCSPPGIKRSTKATLF